MRRLDVRSLKALEKEQVLQIARTGQRFMGDKTIPLWVKIGAGFVFTFCTFLYLWLPIDLIPDAAPVVGTMDDSVGFVAMAVFTAKKWVKEHGLKLAYDQAMNVMAEREQRQANADAARLMP